MLFNLSFSADSNSIVAYEKNGLRITFTLEHVDLPSTISIIMAAFNETPLPLSEFLFQVAVPKVRHPTVFINL